MTTKDTNPKDFAATNRVPLWLLSAIAKAEWAVAQFAGAAKYGAWNWRKSGVKLSVYASAMQRHFDAYMSGEEYDPTDGSHHLGNIMACCGILLDAKAAGKLVDDRPPRLDVRQCYARCEETIGQLRAQYKDKHPRHYTIEDSEPVLYAFDRYGNSKPLDASQYPTPDPADRLITIVGSREAPPDEVPPTVPSSRSAVEELPEAFDTGPASWDVGF